MHRKPVSWFSHICCYLLVTMAVPANAMQIREVPVPHLRDASIATYDQYGPVIYYNPQALKRLGPQISEFVRAHEHAHHFLKHMQREKFSGWQTDMVQMRRSFELEADCYAAKKVSQRVALAAAENFSRTQGSRRPGRLHPTGIERANKIKQCAGIPS